MFVWDAGDIDHLAKHGVLPEEAEQVIENGPLEIERQIRGSESRTLHLGETLAHRVLFVVVTRRGEELRVVTAFPAGRQSRRFYASQRVAIDVQDAGNT
jgi:uncharacterized DUF497 family protein